MLYDIPTSEINDMTTKQIKRISELRNRMDSLKAKAQALSEKKGTLSAEEYRAIAGEYKNDFSAAKEELIELKKAASDELAAFKKQDYALEREQAALEKSIAKLEDELSKGGDKKTITPKLKADRERLKEVHNELTQNLKNEQNISLAIDGTQAVKSTVKTAAPSSSQTKNASIISNPLFLGAAIAVVIIAVITAIVLVRPLGTQSESGDQITQDSETQQSTTAENAVVENIAVEVDMSGSVKGTNVNLRQEPNVSSPAIKQLQNGTKVSVSAKMVAGPNDAVFSRQAQITTESGKKIKLDEGKGVVIIEEKENAFTVRYAVEDGEHITGTVAKDDIRRITGETWFKVKTGDGLSGWIYGQYVDAQ